MEQEFEKLTAAVERIAAALEELAAKDATASTAAADEIVDKKSEAAPKPKKSGDNRVTAAESGDNRVTADDGITYDEMYKVMFEIAQASSEAKKLILPLLKSYGYNHVQKVEPRHYAEIHGQLLTIAAMVAKGEIE